MSVTGDLCALGHTSPIAFNYRINGNFTYQGTDSSNSNKPYWDHNYYSVRIEWGSKYGITNYYVLRQTDATNSFYGYCTIMGAYPYHCDGYWKIYNNSTFVLSSNYQMRQCSYFDQFNSNDKCRNQTHLSLFNMIDYLNDSICIYNPNYQTFINGTYFYQGCNEGLPYYQHQSGLQLYIHWTWKWSLWMVGENIYNTIKYGYCSSDNIIDCNTNKNNSFRAWNSINSEWKKDSNISIFKCNNGQSIIFENTLNPTNEPSYQPSYEPSYQPSMFPTEYIYWTMTTTVATMSSSTILESIADDTNAESSVWDQYSTLIWSIMAAVFAISFLIFGYCLYTNYYQTKSKPKNNNLKLTNVSSTSSNGKHLNNSLKKNNINNNNKFENNRKTNDEITMTSIQNYKSNDNNNNNNNNTNKDNNRLRMNTGTVMLDCDGKIIDIGAPMPALPALPALPDLPKQTSDNINDNHVAMGIAVIQNMHRLTPHSQSQIQQIPPMQQMQQMQAMQTQAIQTHNTLGVRPSIPPNYNDVMNINGNYNGNNNGNDMIDKTNTSTFDETEDMYIEYDTRGQNEGQTEGKA